MAFQNLKILTNHIFQLVITWTSFLRYMLFQMLSRLNRVGNMFTRSCSYITFFFSKYLKVCVKFYLCLYEVFYKITVLQFSRL